MRVTKEHVGYIAGIRFYDHAIGSDVDVIECEVFGRIVDITKVQVVIEHWSVISGGEEVMRLRNAERVAICQGAILSITFFKPSKPIQFN